MLHSYDFHIFFSRADPQLFCWFHKYTALESTAASSPRPPAMHEQKQPSLAVVWDLHFLSPVLEVPMILTVCLCLCPSLLCISLCICVSFFLDGEHRLVVQLWNRGSGWIPVRRIKGAPHGRIWAGNRAESQNQGESRYFAWTHKYISKYTMGRSC